MADTTFVDSATVIQASWLNEINDAIHSLSLPNGSDIVHTGGGQTISGDFTVTGTLLSGTNVLPTEWIVKTADETVINSTTMQNDDHLTFTVEANSIYHVKMHLRLFSDSIQLMKWQWDLPDTGQETMWLLGKEAATGQSVGNEDYNHGNGAAVTMPASDYGEAVLEGIYTSTNAGTATLQWAQNAADAANGHILRKGSYIAVTKIG